MVRVAEPDLGAVLLSRVAGIGVSSLKLAWFEFGCCCTPSLILHRKTKHLYSFAQSFPDSGFYWVENTN